VKGFYPPVLVAPPAIATAFDSICSTPGGLEMMEQMARADNLDSLPLLASSEWSSFSASVRQVFASRDHLILKGLPVSDDGRTLLIAARTIGSMFRTYRGGQIVKYFKMTPWTSKLSHTTRQGEFHTDLNTESCPPAITAMQCFDSDPGAPRYGVSRVARLTDLLAFLEECNDAETLRFLTQDTVTMLNDHSWSSWSGRIVEEGIIHYHPETLRAAACRAGHQAPTLEDRIAGVARAALAVSEPFILDRGDILLLSNYRSLHYRGECSVVFKRFPTEFISRSVFVLHASQEMKGS
jgi:Taurine catabolism dioxygenase TauD, TfdA family